VSLKRTSRRPGGRTNDRRPVFLVPNAVDLTKQDIIDLFTRIAGREATPEEVRELEAEDDNG